MLEQYCCCSYRQPHGGFLYKGGDEIRPSLGPLVENSDLVYQTQVTLNPTHPQPAIQAVQARTDHSNKMVPPSRGIQAICSRWQHPQVDLFATRFNNYISVSPVPDPQAWAVDALSLPWEDLDPYAFPPVAILGKVVGKLQDHPCNKLILIAPGWSNMPWFWDLVTMSSQIPLCMHFLPDL